jgi:hypothetical protein
MSRHCWGAPARTMTTSISTNYQWISIDIHVIRRFPWMIHGHGISVVVHRSSSLFVNGELFSNSIVAGVVCSNNDHQIGHGSPPAEYAEHNDRVLNDTILRSIRITRARAGSAFEEDDEHVRQQILTYIRPVARILNGDYRVACLWHWCLVA